MLRDPWLWVFVVSVVVVLGIGVYVRVRMRVPQSTVDPGYTDFEGDEANDGPNTDPPPETPSF